MVNSLSSGIGELDKLVGGGFLPGSACLVEAESGTEELAFIAAFLNQGLSEGDICGVLDYDMEHNQIISRLANYQVKMREAMDSGSMVVADLWGEGNYDPEGKGPILLAGNISDPNAVLRIFYDLAKIHEMRVGSGKFNGSRSVIYSLSSQLMRYKFEPTYRVMKAGIDIIRQANSVVLTVLSPKMFDETVIVSFEHLHDGIIVLSARKVEENKFQRFVRVKQSPISGYCMDDVGYEIIDGRPRIMRLVG